MTRHRIVFSLLAVFYSMWSWAQQEMVVKGTVSDKQGAFSGVSVNVAGTVTSTVTDAQGAYTIRISSSNAELIFSAVGYVTQQVVVGTSATIDVTLEEEMSSLDEVVVVGYGEVRKKDLTGAVSSVKGSDLAERKTTTLSASLQGAVPGLMVRRDNNAPGASAGSMHIRGVTTIGDSAPLVIITAFLEASIMSTPMMLKVFLCLKMLHQLLFMA